MKLVAEIGCNHQGDFETAKKMIHLAATFCMVDVVKFQKRNPKECLTEEEYNRPHPNPIHAFGKTYGEHREFLEFDIDQHAKLNEYAQELGISYGCSAMDVTSIRELATIKPQYIKIGSGHNLKFELYDALMEHWPGEIHISLGATTFEEVEKIVKYMFPRLNDVVLYACTSSYPSRVEDLYLEYINELRLRFGTKVGFSGHHKGIAPDLAAVTLGTDYLERHFTLDHTARGTDHSASLEADGLRKISKYAKDIKKALKPRPCGILDCEQYVRSKK